MQISELMLEQIEAMSVRSLSKGICHLKGAYTLWRAGNRCGVSLF